MTTEDVAMIVGRLDGLLRWQAAHDEAHKTITRDVTEIRSELYGNGNPGMKLRLQRLDDAVPGNRLRAFVGSVAEKVLANGILAFVVWLLWIYKGH
jgi:hypothetical protein